MKQFKESGIKLFHGDKPIDIEEALKANDYGYFEREDDWSSCAWFYLDTPVNGLPELQSFAIRMAGLDTSSAVAQALA